MNFFMPVRLYTGDSCIAEHSDAFRPFGKRCAVITGRQAAEKSGALQDVRNALEQCSVTPYVWNGVSQNPSVASCRDAGRFARENGADFILGIGGGSALDAAKAAAVFASNPLLEEDGFYRKDWTCAPLPILLVGTTSGTGSEVTKVSVLTDSRGRKHSIHDDRLYAAVAFGDSRYTRELSRTITLTTGVDVLAHASESYFSRKADEISRSFAVRAIRLLSEPLTAAADGESLSPAQRKQLYEASILGGLAINTTGTCFPHNVGYYLTESRGIPHGFASAIFLPDLLRLVGENDRTYADAFFAEIGRTEEELIGITGKCLPAENIFMTEEEILAALPRWENNSSVSNSRANVDTAILREILEQKFII